MWVSAPHASYPLLISSSCDVREPLPDVEDVEQIYHLASPASPDHFDISPIEILETNFLGTKNVLNLAVIRKARVLLASTSGKSSCDHGRHQRSIRS